MVVVGGKHLGGEMNEIWGSIYTLSEAFCLTMVSGKFY